LVDPTHRKSQNVTHLELVQSLYGSIAGNIAVVSKVGSIFIKHESLDVSKLFECSFEILLAQLLNNLGSMANSIERDLHDGFEEEDILGDWTGTDSLNLSVSLPLKVWSLKNRVNFY
jgi:hypothetical protein